MKEVLFKVPLEPPSVNSLYNVIARPKVQVELKMGVRIFKSQFKQFMPLIITSGEIDLILEIVVYGVWKTKDGKRKKKDPLNMAKAIQDAIAEKIGHDDNIFKKTSIEREDSEQNFILVSIREVIQNGEEVGV